MAASALKVLLRQLPPGLRHDAEARIQAMTPHERDELRAWCRDRLAAETTSSTAPRTAPGKPNAGGRKRPVPGGSFPNRPRRART